MGICRIDLVSGPAPQITLHIKKFVFFTWVQKEEKNKEKEECLHDLEDGEGSAQCPWERTATPTFIHFSRLRFLISEAYRMSEPMPCYTEPTCHSGYLSTYSCCYSGSGKFPRRKIGMRREQRWAQMDEWGQGSWETNLESSHFIANPDCVP